MVPHAPRIALAPEGTRAWLGAAVEAGGGQVVDTADATALVWASTTDPDGLSDVLDANPHVGWIQLPFAGVEPYVGVIAAHSERTWTCGKGVYAEPVAEHALGLALAGFRLLGPYAEATAWTAQGGRNLLGSRVTILGGGGITESLLRLLAPFGCSTTVVRRHPAPMTGAQRVLGDEELEDALAGAELLVVALALTPETAGVIDRRRLDLLASGAVVVNVARGPHVVTDDLVAALRDGQISAAGLDVTDPEPLPDGHPLWSIPGVIITPHTANTMEMAIPLLSTRVTENVRRYAAGDDLLGPVDPALGY